jgi:early secretory antigenic target protein ESAT-6
MPDGAMKVDYGTIHEAADHCNTAGSEMDSLFQQLVHDLQPLTQSWTGDAQTQWQDRQKEWNNALDEMKALLARIAIALPEIADGYQKTDKDITNMFGG